MDEVPALSGTLLPGLFSSYIHKWKCKLNNVTLFVKNIDYFWKVKMLLFGDRLGRMTHKQLSGLTFATLILKLVSSIVLNYLLTLLNVKTYFSLRLTDNLMVFLLHTFDGFKNLY